VAAVYFFSLTLYSTHPLVVPAGSLAIVVQAYHTYALIG